MKKQQLRSVAIRIETWKAAKTYGQKNSMSLADFVTAALEFAMQKNLKIQKTVEVTEESK